MIDVVVLSYCKDQESFLINVKCVESLIDSEPQIRFNILIIESNAKFKELNLEYAAHNVTVIIPNEPFNFNRFLNIGLKQSKAEWIIFSNNDVIFHKGWLSEIFRIQKSSPATQSFCPFDRTSPYLAFEKFSKKSFHLGYRVPVEFVGWCYVMNKSVFEKTGLFDETFDLYFQDNDVAMTLKKHKIVHAMVPQSFVEHLGGYTTRQKDGSASPKYAEDKVKYLNKWKESPLDIIRGKLFSALRFFRR